MRDAIKCVLTRRKGTGVLPELESTPANKQGDPLVRDAPQDGDDNR
jgi:hypothetical protein